MASSPKPNPRTQEGGTEGIDLVGVHVTRRLSTTPKPRQSRSIHFLHQTGVDFSVVRADDICRPGAIYQDIFNEIVDSDVVVVDISPTEKNENVFYELGLSHALRKPTILLADKSRELPFDVSGFRVVFYTDTIRGKGELVKELKKHLESIKRADNSS
jgi:hypothetical protein